MSGEMTFLEHLSELRKYLIRSFVAVVIGAVLVFAFYDEVVRILTKPFEEVNSQLSDKELFVNSIFEGFLVKVKVSILFGFVLTFPIHMVHIIQFIFPALTKKEKKVVIIFITMSFLLIVTSVLYSYTQIIPISIQFLTGAGFIPDNVGLLLSYGSNIFFVFQFLIASLVLFQLPLILIILMMMNVLKRASLMSYHRYIVLGLFLGSAILTPPDPASMVAVAIPLIAFFYLTILVAKILKFGE